MGDKKNVMVMSGNTPNKKICIIGGGVAGMTAVTNLIDQGYPGNMITVIDKGRDVENRPEDEVMIGQFGAGLKSDGKYSYLHNAVGGHLAKYFGEEKSDELNERSLNMLLRFHPDPSKVVTSDPIKEPEYIKPYFSLRMASNKHVGTDYLHETGKRWNKWLIDKGVNFLWETEVIDIDFNHNYVYIKGKNEQIPSSISFDKLIYCTGKSGIDLTQNLIDKYDLEKEPKSVQVGVRFIAPQHYFQNILDIAYDFKLYQKPNDKVSLRSFCLPPGEKIMIQREGIILYENIENITVNDKVLTYNIKENKTEFINPINTTSRFYNDKIYNINDNELRVTKDHEIFLLENQIVKKEGITKSGKNIGKKWWNYVNELSKIVEVKAENLNIGDRILRPQNFGSYINDSNIENDILNLDFYYILGLWMADGSASYKKYNNGINVNPKLGNNIQIVNERYVLEEVKNFLDKKWIHSTWINKENYSILNFNSKFFIKYLQEVDLYKKGKERGLPNNIYSLNKNEIWMILSGMIDGDGRVKKEHNVSIDYFTSSEIMIRDLSYLLSLLNIKFSIQKRKNKVTNFSDSSTNYQINICDRDSINILKNNLKLKNIKKRNTLLLDNDENNFNPKQYQKIFNIEREEYEGIVYDLTIPKTHNFIAGKIPLVIHNCTNSGASYIAEEETYSMKSYNGHSYKGRPDTGFVNFGIIMEIKGIENPFEWQKELVKNCQIKVGEGNISESNIKNTGLYFSPNMTLLPPKDSEGNDLNLSLIYNIEYVENCFGEYFKYIKQYIDDLNKVFKFGDEYGIFVPEVKYLSEEVKVNYDDLSLIQYPHVHFCGDSLSARGIIVSQSQAMGLTDTIIKNLNKHN